LEVIHSEQSISYLLKYYSKNSDVHPVTTALCEGGQISSNQPLQYYAASRISSAIECFSAICGDRRDHLSPTVGLLAVHLEGKTVLFVCARDRGQIHRKLQQPSPLERHFGRPIGSPDNDLTYAQYYSLFQTMKKEQGAQCFQSDHIIRKSKSALYILRDVCFKDRERFCLRLLLGEIPARSWEQLRTVGRRVPSTFADAALGHGLIADKIHEAHVAIRSAIALNRPLSDLRFLFAIGIELGASF
jgi:hypothetical protein